MQPLPSNGNITLSLPGPFTLHLYFNSNPSNNWNEPATFSSGKEIARFKREVILFSSIGPCDFTISGAGKVCYWVVLEVTMLIFQSSPARISIEE